MIKAILKFLSNLWEFGKNFLAYNLMQIVFIIGVSMFIASFGFEASYRWNPYMVIPGPGLPLKDILHAVGSVTLGAGVFAAVMKSVQFTKVFQSHIAHVLYKPEKLKEAEVLESKWRLLTDSMLKSVLPLAYEDATKQMQSLFFKEDQDYHLEDYVCNFLIKEVNENTVKVISTVEATAVVSTGSKNAIYKPSIRSDGIGETEFGLLLINQKPPQFNEKYEPVKDKKNVMQLTLDLAKYVENNDIDSPDRRVKLEREVTYIKNVVEDPLIVGRISRYVKGLTVRVVVDSTNFKVELARFGPKDLPKERHTSTLRKGKTEEQWILGKSGELLLPGQGYTMCITIDKSAKQ